MKKLSSILIGMGLLVLCACGGATYITPSSDSVNFSIEGGEEKVTISADGNWDIAECPDWVTTEIQEDVLVIKTKANETGSILEGDIVLKGKDDVEATIGVTQASSCTYITVSETEVVIPKEGGTKEISVDTDGAKVIIEASDGINAELTNETLSISAPSNQGFAKKGTVTLACDTVTTIVNVSIEGSVCKRCNGKGKISCTHCYGRGYNFSGDAPVACTKCGGHGLLGEPDIPGYPPMGGRKGSGRMACPECGGSGH